MLTHNFRGGGWSPARSSGGGWELGTSENGGEQRAKILIVDDDRDLLSLLEFLVKQAGFVPVTASQPVGAIEVFGREDPSVAVIDLNLSPGDGFELVAELRRRSSTLPILVLTARANEDDKVRALDSGADDYVVKPFGHRELVARIKAHARRAEHDRGPGRPGTKEKHLEVGTLRLDLESRAVEIDGEEELRLTGTEFRLLEYLMRNGGSIVPTEALARQVWGYDDAPAREVIRVTVHRLRRKLGDDGDRRRIIETVPGVGLRLRSVPARRTTERSV
jgi:DNA-binding response OmpR family regulator